MESSSISHLYLVRHGVTAWNQEKKYMGHSDLPILKDGLRDYGPLKEFFKLYPPDLVYASDLRRCRQTAAYLFPGAEVSTDPRLRELFFGTFEGKTYEQLKDLDSYRDWLQNWPDAAPDQGEESKAFSSRITLFKEQVLDARFQTSGGRCVVVTHGGVIRELLTLYQPELTYWDIPTPFGNAYHLILNAKGGGVQCKSLSVVPIQASGVL